MALTTDELLCAGARAYLPRQRADGSFPPGHNGPWGDVDTPVRVTSHALVLLTAAYQRTHDVGLRDAARRAADYLCRPGLRPGGAGFRCFVSDCPWMATNALIGQAWALEGLLEAGRRLDRGYLDVAAAVAEAHPLDADRGLWRVASLGGEVGPVHPTLNHQLWFSVMALQVAREAGRSALEAAALRHFARLPDVMHVEGRYLHMQIAPRYREGPPARVAPLWRPDRRLRDAVHAYRDARYETERSIGYLSFTLYAAALLHRLAPALPLWQDARWLAAVRSSVAFADDRLFTLPPHRNRYAYSYNPVGIEMAVVRQQLGPLLGPGGRDP